VSTGGGNRAAARYRLASMRHRGRAGVVLAVALAGAVACGVDAHRAAHPDDAAPEFSADKLDLSEQDSILELLEPEEREAFARAGMSGARPEHLDLADDETETKADTAGKVSLSVLTVALSVGAAVAPFFLL
jgi:hypothetical protein